MKTYEIYVSVNYTTEGGSEQQDLWLEYVDAATAIEAEDALRSELETNGYKVTNMETVEC